MDPIERAFKAVPRQNFMTDEYRQNAGLDTALPIGHGQTISQPSTVERMLRWLEVQPGDKVLDVGSGSGWTTALLAHLTGPTGRVYAVELVPELVEFGHDNAQRMGVKNARFFQAGKDYGLPRFAPYDRILVSAAADELPKELPDQLGPGGKLVIPVRHDILEIEKISETDIETKTHSGYIFVPLIKGGAPLE